jgi:hypothetical protein
VLLKPDELTGEQRPRICHIPSHDDSTAVEAIEMVRAAGIDLDPWEEFILGQSLNEREGRWAAFEVGFCVPRQNGKGEIELAREIVGLFLLGEGLIVHTAHLFETSKEHFRRVQEVIEGTPEFSRRVKKRGVKQSHGEEGIELTRGQRIRFRTRTKGGGRGLGGDLLVLDEAMELPEAVHGALLPILSARPNPQVIYAGSAVDEWVHENGVVFTRVRERGLAGTDPSLAYFEHSVEGDSPEEVGDAADDPRAWAQANPGLGIRISATHIANERRSMDGRTFAVERLGVGAWPATDETGQQVLSPQAWAACEEVGSKPVDPLCFAFDVTPDRSATSIGVASERKDGKLHIEVIERRRGTGWAPERLVELKADHRPSAILCDGAGPAAALLGPLANLGVEVTAVNAKEYAQACGILYDACEQKTLRHLGSADLNAAVKGATKRPLGDAWVWSRKSSGIDISPLVAVTLALWGAVALSKASPSWVL